MNPQTTIDPQGLNQLIESLIKTGYQVMGPTLRDGAIIYDTISKVEELPQGWTDEQDGGLYRLKRRSDQAFFGYVVGPHSWKKFLHTPHKRLWRAEKKDETFQIIPDNRETKKLAFIGVRSCELHAIAIQDKVFLQGEYVDASYQDARKDLLVIAVNCGQAGGTCFCASMNTGPKASSGYDLVLTEVINTDQHYFVVEEGSEKGTSLLKKIQHKVAENSEIELAETIHKKAAQQMGRTLDTTNIKTLLYNNPDHPRWDNLAERCLSCANCTMACPTCFCSTVEDVTDVTGNHAERWQRWDSCFTMDFSYLHGGNVRSSTKSRYRQWMTHKLASWMDQFDSSGCVGCGRCITWCPVGIDFTEEVRVIRETSITKNNKSSDNEASHEKP